MFQYNLEQYETSCNGFCAMTPHLTVCLTRKFSATLHISSEFIFQYRGSYFYLARLMSSECCTRFTGCLILSQIFGARNSIPRKPLDYIADNCGVS